MIGFKLRIIFKETQQMGANVSDDQNGIQGIAYIALQNRLKDKIVNFKW